MKMQTLIVCASLAGALVSFPATATSPEHAESDLRMPKSMEEFITHQIDGNDFGIWVKSGVTQEMWAGLPAGMKYTERSESRLSEDGTYIIDNYMMTTEDGKVISTGSGITYWDEKLGEPVSASSGFDMGKPYSGTGRLQGIARDKIVWKYTETSRGATTEYLSSMTRSGANEQTNTVKKTGTGGSAWSSTATRVNGLKVALDGHDPTGTWDMALPDGNLVRSIVSWGPGDRSLVERSLSVKKDGTSEEIGMGVIYWDPADAAIRNNWLTVDGKVFSGRVITTTNANGMLTMTMEVEGSNSIGDVLTATNTRTVEGNTQTTTWSDVAVNGHLMKLGWVDVPLVAKRSTSK